METSFCPPNKNTLNRRYALIRSLLQDAPWNGFVRLGPIVSRPMERWGESVLLSLFHDAKRCGPKKHLASERQGFGPPEPLHPFCLQRFPNMVLIGGFCVQSCYKMDQSIKRELERDVWPNRVFHPYGLSLRSFQGPKRTSRQRSTRCPAPSSRRTGSGVVSIRGTFSAERIESRSGSGWIWAC